MEELTSGSTQALSNLSGNFLLGTVSLGDVGRYVVVLVVGLWSAVGQADGSLA